MPSAKRHHIQHINFIEKESVSLTYRAMILIVLMVVSCGVATYMVQKTRLKYLEKRAATLNAEITALKANRDRIMTEMAKQGEKSTQSKVRNSLMPVFEDAEGWSSLLKEITGRIPHSMWLQDIRTEKRKDLPSQKGIQISGEAYQPEVVTFFVKALGNSKLFQQIILTSMEQRTDDKGKESTYQFSIEMGIASKKPEPAVADGGAQ